MIMIMIMIKERSMKRKNEVNRAASRSLRAR